MRPIAYNQMYFISFIEISLGVGGVRGGGMAHGKLATLKVQDLSIVTVLR